MDSNLNRNSRIAMLVVALSLIGGTGCVHYLITRSASETNEQRDARLLLQQKENQDRFQREALRQQEELKQDALKIQKRELVEQQKIEALVKGASANDPHSKTYLALEYLKPNGKLPRDVLKGLNLLKSAVSDKYPEAEYLYGWLLIQGALDNGQYKLKLKPSELALSPESGIRLVSTVASKKCSIYLDDVIIAPGGEVYQLPVVHSPSWDLMKIYSDGRYISRDRSKFELWFARTILHCNEYFELSQRQPLRFAGYEYFSDAKALAFFLLQQDMYNKPKDAERKNQFAKTLKPEQIQEANTIAEQLRSAVRQSEQEFPAPRPFVMRK